VVFAGTAQLNEVIEAINQGYMFRYVTKPFVAGELRDVVRQAVEHYDRIVEREQLLRNLEEANRLLQEQYERLQELDRLKTAFMAVASHELRTPVTLIGGYAGFLEKLGDRLNPDLVRDMTAKIQEGARRLERIIRAMFQAVESGGPRPSLDVQETNVARLVQQAVDDARPFIEKRRLNVTTALHPVPPAVVDVTKLRDVIDNLLINAIKFTPDGGTIELSVRPGDAPDRLAIAVQDSGVGIGERDLKHIFSPMFGTFDTLHHSSGVYEFQRRGIGLGLSVSKQFVEMHGGQIAIESQVGKGTCVRISLPLRPPASPATAEGFERTALA
jgi:signal transduction histidine kinase